MTDKHHEPLSAVVAKYASSRIYRQILGVVTSLLRPKLLAKADFGLWTAFFRILNYSTFADFGSQTAMRFLIPYHRAAGREDKARAIRDTVLTTSLGMNLLLAAGLVACGCLPGFAVEVRFGFVAMAGVVVLQCLYEYDLSVLKAYERFSLVTSSNYVFINAQFFLTIPLLYFFRLYGLFASLLLTYAVTIVYLRSRFWPEARLRFDFSTFRELVSAGFPVVLLNLAVTLLRTTAVFVVLVLMGKEATGAYGVALLFFNFLIQIPGAGREVMEPRLMSVIEHDAPHATLNEYLLRPLVNTAYFMPFLIGPAFFGLPVFIRLVLPRYADGIPTTRVLLFGAYFLALAYVPRMLIIARNLQWRSALYLPPIIALNVILAIYLGLGPMGMAGVALAGAVSFFLLLVTLMTLVGVTLESKSAEWTSHVWGAAAAVPLTIGGAYALDWATTAAIPGEWGAAIVGLAAYMAAMLAVNAWATRTFALKDGLDGLWRQLARFTPRPDDDV